MPNVPPATEGHLPFPARQKAWQRNRIETISGKFRLIRFICYHLCPGFRQKSADTNRWALAQVIYICLIRQAQRPHPAAREPAYGAFHQADDKLGLTIVDFARRADQSGDIRCRFDQEPGINADTMPSYPHTRG